MLGGRISHRIRRSRTNKKSMDMTKKELTFEKRRLEALFKHSMDGIALLDSKDRILEINQSFTDLFGYTIEEIKGMHIDDILPGDKYAEARELTDRVLHGEPMAAESVRIRKDGSKIEVSVKGVPVLIEGKVMGIFALYADITDRKRYEERLKYLGMYDSLTGLYNRAFFEDSINNLDTKDHLPLTVIMADINGLKLLNDTFGHAIGDKLLAKISDIFKKVCRVGDIVCRYGGDEFAMIFPNTTESQAEEIISRIKRACLSEEIQSLPLSISMGVACKTNPDENIQQVIKEAEDKMYRNKLLDSKSSRNSLIASLQKTLREKTHETQEHSQRMKEMALLLGKKLGLPNSDLDELVLLCTLHDIGKVAIPDEILSKEGPLSDEEWEVMKTHPEIGYRIAMTTPELMTIAKKILAHHERWDGKGYPHKLKGVEIPLASRIISIVDAFDVMTSGRPYSKAMTNQEALDELLRCSGTQFDPKLVEIFIKEFQRI